MLTQRRVRTVSSKDSSYKCPKSRHVLASSECSPVEIISTTNAYARLLQNILSILRFTHQVLGMDLFGLFNRDL